MKTLKETKEYLFSLLGDKDFDEDDLNNGYKFQKLFHEVPELKHVESIGGEGEGDFYQDVWSVTFPDGDVVLVALEGEYNSWAGVYWDSTELKIVEPVQVTYTEYKVRKQQ